MMDLMGGWHLPKNPMIQRRPSLTTKIISHPQGSFRFFLQLPLGHHPLVLIICVRKGPCMPLVQPNAKHNQPVRQVKYGIDESWLRAAEKQEASFGGDAK